MHDGRHLSRADEGKLVDGPSGKHIGLVQRAETGFFLLARADAGHCWLPESVIFTHDEWSITLICERQNVPKYAVPVTKVRRQLGAQRFEPPHERTVA